MTKKLHRRFLNSFARAGLSVVSKEVPLVEVCTELNDEDGSQIVFHPTLTPDPYFAREPKVFKIFFFLKKPITQHISRSLDERNK